MESPLSTTKLWPFGLLIPVTALALFSSPADAQVADAPAVEFPAIGNRTAVWIVSQLHILFAAFILAEGKPCPRRRIRPFVRSGFRLPLVPACSPRGRLGRTRSQAAV
jgi:hypothetical protein